MRLDVISYNSVTSEKDRVALDPWNWYTTMWGPQDSVQLVQITPITMVYGTYDYG